MPMFLHVRSAKWPILDGEDNEIVNPSTYGKAFAEYLRSSLSNLGYDVPFCCCEDWGWWVEVKLPNKRVGLCCYRDHDENTDCDFVCSTSLDKNRVWCWSRFRFVDLTRPLAKLSDDLRTIFRDDPEVEYIGEVPEFPLWANQS